jgi:hypothetical protein
MLKSRFPGKPQGRAQSARTRVSTGKILAKGSGGMEPGTSGLYEADNIKKGFATFLEFCGDSDEGDDEVSLVFLCPEPILRLLHLQLQQRCSGARASSSFIDRREG